MFRLLEVDRRCVLPLDLTSRVCVTSSDVIHSWALPSLSVKVDAIGGLLSVFLFDLSFCGVFYGQCSEICGSNHSFIPICLEVSPSLGFIYWLLEMIYSGFYLFYFLIFSFCIIFLENKIYIFN